MSVYRQLLDLVVPFGPYLRGVDKNKQRNHYITVLQPLGLTFFMYWLFSFLPFGTLLYMTVMVGLSAWVHILSKENATDREKYRIFLWYFIVIAIGFGSIRGFIGHFFLSESVAESIGWATGSPFQLELAFYHLGIGIAALLCIWLKDHIWTSVVIIKSIFLYGAAYVHLMDWIINNNAAQNNTGAVLLGDILIPTILLYILYKSFPQKPPIKSDTT